MAGRGKLKRPTLTPGWVTYGRTSSEEAQAPERSLGSQRRLNLERLIEGTGLPFIEEYSDIYSGRSTDRKNYQRLLSDARDGKFSHVGIAFVDRFGRNDVEGIRAFDELVRLGITVRIATYPSLDPATPDGRMIVTMLFGVARFESDRIGQRCKEGMHTKLLGGDWAWKAPDGYLNKEKRLTEIGPEMSRDERQRHARYKRWTEIDPVQSKVWRYAWDLLLEDRLSLAEICEALHKQGYRLRTGVPFIKVTKQNRRVPNVGAVSRSFHNWFYAGWIMLDADWASIPPKTVRGTWEPVVSTEEFEMGLAILEKHNENRSHHKRRFYLLQGLICLKYPDGDIVKLTCSTPNANRDRGGVPYYCVPSSDINFLCYQIDLQVAAHLKHIQVDTKWLPSIREVYIRELEQRIGKSRSSDRATMEKMLKDIADEELRAARQHAKKQMSDETWEALWREWQDQRDTIKSALEAMDRNCETHIATLDEALRLIEKAGILFDKLSLPHKQQLLRYLVKRVIINPEGRIVKMELRPPFSYLSRLTKNARKLHDQEEGKNAATTPKMQPPKKTSGSSWLSLGPPNESQDEPESSSSGSVIEFLESIEYPQRLGIERLLTEV